MENEFTLPQINGFDLVAMGPADSDGYRSILVDAGDGTYIKALWKNGARQWAWGRYRLSLDEGLKQVFG